jgi:3',5'-cyclic AMP phosphodiesterase CpdA
MTRCFALALLLPLFVACTCGRVHTRFPSADRPDQFVLTFAGDPKDSIRVSWRTGPEGTAEHIEVRPSGSDRARIVHGNCVTADSREWVAVANDPVIRRCSADLTGLAPDAEYDYRPADTSRPDEPLPWHRFRTAPATDAGPLTFIVLGDVQTGIEDWSPRYREVIARHSEARFTIQAGDLVNLGARRTDYDEVLGGAAPAFASVPFVPVLGNHEYMHDGVRLFERMFALSGDGPSGPGHCRAFDYGPVRVVVLDSTSADSRAAQAEWLAARLDESRAPWKIVAFHHPIWPPRSWFSSSGTRDAWMSTIENHGVHLVLNGHDHSYARTVPLRAGVPAPDGTTYVVSVSGAKHYDQAESPLFAKARENTSTYLVVTASRERLSVSARTWDGSEIDRWERTQDYRTQTYPQ